MRQGRPTTDIAGLRPGPNGRRIRHWYGRDLVALVLGFGFSVGVALLGAVLLEWTAGL